jgi:hypothetical protein
MKKRAEEGLLVVRGNNDGKQLHTLLANRQDRSDHSARRPWRAVDFLPWALASGGYDILLQMSEVDYCGLLPISESTHQGGSPTDCDFA